MKMLIDHETLLDYRLSRVTGSEWQHSLKGHQKYFDDAYIASSQADKFHSKILDDHSLVYQFQHFMTEPTTMAFYLNNRIIEKKAAMALTLMVDGYVPDFDQDILLYVYTSKDGNRIRVARTGVTLL